jgi:hypothetical protein
MKDLPSKRPVSAKSGRKEGDVGNTQRRVKPFTRTVGRLIGQQGAYQNRGVRQAPFGFRNAAMGSPCITLGFPSAAFGNPNAAFVNGCVTVSAGQIAV